MLRVNTKNKFLQMIKNLISICEKAIHAEEETLISILVESQEAIIAIGNCIEKERDSAETVDERQSYESIIILMEKLCECFYQLSQNLDSRKFYGEQIYNCLTKIQSKMEALSACYQIVFFPYKADMWDSLESIWFACKEDPACDCKVVPVPYNYCNTDTGEWEYRYEIDRFPEYVPVINYKEYDLSECADAAFIHNPYDEGNYVTNLHKDYFSSNLKKYVKTLFYSPYYVTSGFIADDHKDLSAYRYADYLVVQSESFKEGLKDHGYDAKALVMGSPKLDRVISLSQSRDVIPEEWREILEGRKSLMLNTSLNQFLYDGEAYLQKLRYIFDVVKTEDDVVIIWRPHPLLQSTIESLRPELLDAYLELKDYFINEKIGLFDATPDIINTVAIADGYIGEGASASSVVNLFEAAGKPLFILNNFISEAFSKEEQHQLFFCDCERIDNKIYGVFLESSSIISVENNDWCNMQTEAVVTNTAKWIPAFTRMAIMGEHIFLNSAWAEEFYSYDRKTKDLEQISAISDKSILNYRFVIEYNGKVFYLPSSRKQIMEYDICSKEWKEHIAPIEALQKNIIERIWEDICDYFVKNNEVWMTNLYSNRILRFCMETGAYQIYEIGNSSARYYAITIAEDVLYLSNANNGSIEAWNLRNMQLVKTYTMPIEYQTFQNVQNRRIAHTKLFVSKNNLIAVPGYANALVKINLQTDKVSLLAEPFFADVMEPANNYKPQVHGIITMAKMLDDATLFIQSRRDASLLELNVLTGEYQVHYPKLADGELEKLIDGEDGFEKSYTNGEFARRESRYFSFEGFLDDLVHERFDDAMKRQKEELQTMAVNLDGTCGEKVHAFMMDILEKSGE